MAAVAGVGVGVTGLPFYTFGIFMTPLSQAFGWSRSQVAVGMLCLNLGLTVTAPLIGKVIDRHGVRKIALASLVGLAVGFGLVALSGPSITSFYAAWIALAFFGCGTTPLTWTRAINLEFRKARGLALGIALLGTGLASIVGPPAIQSLITAYGFRAAYVAIGLFVLVFVLPIAAFGLQGSDAEAGPATDGVALTGTSYREAIGTASFWLIAASILVMILGQAGATVHLVPMLRDRGMEAGKAAATAGLLGFSVIVGRVLVGYLVDRFPAPKVASVFFMLPAIGMAILFAARAQGGEIVAVLLLGLSAGAEVDILAYLVSRYFGMRSYGAIYGSLLSIFGVAGGLGPVLVARAYDAAKSYQPALVGGAILFIVGAITIGCLGAYPSFDNLVEAETEGRNGETQLLLD